MRSLGFICLIIAGSLLSGCSGNNSSGKKTDSLATTDTGILADKNFVLQNVTDTRKIDEFKLDKNERLYADSTRKIAFVELTPAQKVKLLAAAFEKEFHVNSDYVRDRIVAHFIAKQTKMGGLQPIIVQVDGDDYGALKMILLDKNTNVVNAFDLVGGFLPGPEEIGDSLERYDDLDFSIISKNIVTTIKTVRTDHNDTLKKSSMIDSMVSRTIIGADGKLSIKRILKTRYAVPAK